MTATDCYINEISNQFPHRPLVLQMKTSMKTIKLQKTVFVSAINHKECRNQHIINPINIIN